TLVNDTTVEPDRTVIVTMAAPTNAVRGLTRVHTATIVDDDQVGTVSAILADGPLGYWRLDETSGTTAFDSSPNGYNGTFFGNVTLGVAGALLPDDHDSAARFGGGGAQADVPFHPEFNLPNGFTIEAWAKPEATSGFHLIASYTTGSNGYGLGILDGRLNFTTF